MNMKVKINFFLLLLAIFSVSGQSSAMTEWVRELVSSPPAKLVLISIPLFLHGKWLYQRSTALSDNYYNNQYLEIDASERKYQKKTGRKIIALDQDSHAAVWRRRKEEYFIGKKMMMCTALCAAVGVAWNAILAFKSLHS